MSKYRRNPKRLLRLGRAMAGGLLVVACLGLVACGNDDGGDSTTGGSDSADAGSTSDLREVTLRLDWLPSSSHAGFYVAKDQGFYEAEGLDVEILPGEGNQPIQQVGSGADTFGFAYGTGIVQGNNEGSAVKAVANIAGDADGCIVVRADSGITQPSDLEGKTLAHGTGSAFAAMLPAVWKESDTNPDEVTVRAISPAAGISSLVQGRIDGWIGTRSQSPVTMQTQFDTKGDCLAFRDHGAGTMGPSIIASDETIANDPELVQSFVDASMEGWRYAFDHVDEAADALVAGSSGVEGSFPPESFRLGIPLFEDSVPTDATAGSPYGAMAGADWEHTLDLMGQYLGLKDAPPLADIYTNQFVEGQEPLG